MFLKRTVVGMLVLQALALSELGQPVNSISGLPIGDRPLPQWFDEAKIGVFMHWGLYSVPSYGTEWYWHNLCSCPSHKGRGGCPQSSSSPFPAAIVQSNDANTAPTPAAVGRESLCDFHDRVYGVDFSYSEFAPMFRAELLDLDHWIDVFKSSGVKYVVPTSKHHDGFCLWPCPGSWAWNSVDDGPHRDLIGNISAAVRQTDDLHVAVYFSTFDWFNPLYLADKANGGNTTSYVDQVMWPQFKDLVERYRPDFIRMDGSWEMSTDYWKAGPLLEWLYTQSPVKDTVVVTDSWGKDNCEKKESGSCHCKYGDSWTCGDKFSPGQLMPHKWEHDTTIQKTSWGFDRSSGLNSYKTLKEILSELVPTIALGGNFLINIGPTSDGRILPVFEERLRQMGAWLSVNGEAIYATKPWSKAQKENTTNTYYTSKPTKTGLGNIYAIFLDWPSDGVVRLTAPTPAAGATVQMLGYTSADLKFSKDGNAIAIKLPVFAMGTLPCTDAWALQLSSFT